MDAKEESLAELAALVAMNNGQNLEDSIDYRIKGAEGCLNHVIVSQVEQHRHWAHHCIDLLQTLIVDLRVGALVLAMTVFGVTKEES